MHLALGYPVLLFFFLKPFVNLQRAVLGLFLIYIQVGSIPGDIQKKNLAQRQWNAFIHLDSIGD
jgi:hypothetical protein